MHAIRLLSTTRPQHRLHVMHGVISASVPAPLSPASCRIRDERAAKPDVGLAGLDDGFRLCGRLDSGAGYDRNVSDHRFHLRVHIDIRGGRVVRFRKMLLDRVEVALSE